jgi:predicted AlkP superfamily pyrophosphatase or phosphodiesterase
MTPRIRACVAAICLVAVAVLASCRSAPIAPAQDRPALVVLLVVDQLAPGLLSQYQDLFTGGIRRLFDEGYGYPNATHDHASTATAPGHTTLSTGVYPSRSGIVGNEWSVRDGDGWRTVYAVEDLESPILGYPDLPGRGPRNILSPGLPDWILAADRDARVLSISAKDRAAIGMAATAPGQVYWLTQYGGEFTTSRHYLRELPDWVVDFNRNEMPGLYSDTLWVNQTPRDVWFRSRADSSAYELAGEHTWFPHRPSDRVDPTEPGAINFWRWNYTPFSDHAVGAFARRAVEELDLGRRGHTDFLGVSFSSTDLVGHYYGPGSREQLDNLLRLDQELGAFFTFLDERIGRGRWVLAMSADHGVLEIPEELAQMGVPARRLTRADRQDLVAALQGAASLHPGDEEAAKAAALQFPWVATAYTFEGIERGEAADTFEVLYRNSFSDTRIVPIEGRWGVNAREAPYTLDVGSPPASHGSPYYYDRHVPLYFLGARIAPGTSEERVATVDVAPTLARLAGIPMPDDLDGHVLESALPQ